MLSFGAAFYTVKQESGYTHVNGKRESVIREIEVPVTIEIVDKKNPFYGCVKTDITVTRDKDFFKSTYDDIYTYSNQRLWDLVDMRTGYVLARTFKSELREAIKTLAEFMYTENGMYVAPNGFVITSKLRYHNVNTLES